MGCDYVCMLQLHLSLSAVHRQYEKGDLAAATRERQAYHQIAASDDSEMG